MVRCERSCSGQLLAVARSDKTLAIVTATRCNRVTPMIKDCQIELGRRNTLGPFLSCSFIHLPLRRARADCVDSGLYSASSLFVMFNEHDDRSINIQSSYSKVAECSNVDHIASFPLIDCRTCSACQGGCAVRRSAANSISFAWVSDFHRRSRRPDESIR